MRISSRESLARSSLGSFEMEDFAAKKAPEDKTAGLAAGFMPSIGLSRQKAAEQDRPLCQLVASKEKYEEKRMQKERQLVGRCFAAAALSYFSGIAIFLASSAIGAVVAPLFIAMAIVFLLALCFSPALADALTRRKWDKIIAGTQEGLNDVEIADKCKKENLDPEIFKYCYESKMAK